MCCSFISRVFVIIQTDQFLCWGIGEQAFTLSADSDCSLFSGRRKENWELEACGSPNNSRFRSLGFKSSCACVFGKGGFMFVISLWSFHFLLRLSVYFQDPQSSFCSTSTSRVGRGISAGSSALILLSFGAAERQNLGFNLIRFTLNVILKHNEQKLVQTPETRSCLVWLCVELQSNILLIVGTEKMKV